MLHSDYIFILEIPCLPPRGWNLELGGGEDDGQWTTVDAKRKLIHSTLRDARKRKYLLTSC